MANSNIEKTVSNFIPSQFPQFYLEDGRNFVLFVKEYFRWLETPGNPVGEARKLLDYIDIDNTEDSLLSHFASKFLFNFPQNTIVDQRFLIKHILDLYRAKGSTTAFELLFRILYNADVKVYLPKKDILKASDGIWIQPQYIEVSNNNNLSAFVGKSIIGVTSGTTAVVESLTSELVNIRPVNSLYLSNVNPPGKQFIQGERIVIQGHETSMDVSGAPTILGSLNNLLILNGSENFNIGDVIKITQDSPQTPPSTLSKTTALGRVTELVRGYGSINFDISDGGTYYQTNSDIFIINGSGDITGQGAIFSIGSVAYVVPVTYNTDILCDYGNTLINAASYGFPASPSGNNGSTLATLFSYTNGNFGTISSLTGVNTGNSYTQPLQVFIKSTLTGANALPGTINFSTASSNVVGTSTVFPAYFSNGDVINLIANSSFSEKHVIKSVANNTFLTLYDKPKSTNTAGYFKVAPLVMPANFFSSNIYNTNPDNSISGNNAVITGLPSSGNNVVGEIAIIDSGKGFVDGKTTYAYLYNSLANPTIVLGGLHYTNGDIIVVTGDPTTSIATGYVTTNTTGGITAAIWNYSGSNYTQNPILTIDTNSGFGAILTTSIVDFSGSGVITGLPIKYGIGVGAGYWSSTKGFLNSNKYIQDSYFYQDYSYELQTSIDIDQYKNILYDTGFHPSGSEMFGAISNLDEVPHIVSVLYDTTTMKIS